MPRYGTREITAPDFVEGRMTEEEIPKRSLLRQLELRAQYDVVTTGGTGAGAPAADAAFRLQDFIRIMSGGKPLHDVRGHSLGKLIKLFFPEEPAQTDPTDDAAGTESDRVANTIIPFWMFGSLQPDLFALPTWAADVVIQIGTADALELFDTAVDGAFAFDNGAYRLFERPIFGVNKNPATRWGGLSLRHIRRAVSQTGTIRVPLNHLRPGHELRMVMIEGMGSGSGGGQYVHEDDIVDTVRFTINGDDEIEETLSSQIQQQNKVAYQLAALEAGVYVLDPAENGRTGPGELWPIISKEDAELELDITLAAAGDTQVVVTTAHVIRGSLERRTG